MQQVESPEINVVRAGAYDALYTVYRFTGTEAGKRRANEYADAYNESLREAMNVPKDDLGLQSPDFHARPGEYERALKVQQYREHSAIVVTRNSVEIIGDDDPMPTEYPHEF